MGACATCQTLSDMGLLSQSPHTCPEFTTAATSARRLGNTAELNGENKTRGGGNMKRQQATSINKRSVAFFPTIGQLSGSVVAAKA